MLNYFYIIYLVSAKKFVNKLKRLNGSLAIIKKDIIIKVEIEINIVKEVDSDINCVL